MWLVTPVYPTTTLDPMAMIYIGLCYGGFFLGCAGYALANGVSESRVVTSNWQKPFASGLFWGTMLIGLSGMGLRLYDRVVLRGTDYATNAVEIRELLTQATAGSASVIAAVLFPFCFIPLIVLLAARFNRTQTPLYIVAGIVFFLPAIESLAQLSRSIMLTTIVLGFSAVVCTKFKGNAGNRKLIVATALAIVVLSIASTFVFSSRLGLTDRRLSDSVIMSSYADNLQPTENAWYGLVAGSEAESLYYSTILPNGMYYLSGLFEFSTLWTRPDPQPFAYGAYNAIAYTRAVQIVLLPDSEPLNEEALVYRPGVFQTFFGGTWVDFGYFGPAFLFIFGYLASMLSLRARSGSVSTLPIYLYCSTIIFFMPVSNFINGGLGNYIIASFTVIAILFSRPSERLSGQSPSRPRQAAPLAPGGRH